MVVYVTIRRRTRSTRTDTLFPYATLFRARQNMRRRPQRAEHRARIGKGDAVAAPVARRARNVPAARAEQIGRAHAELQSLMRISYAVFCLKKKKYTKPITLKTPTITRIKYRTTYDVTQQSYHNQTQA